MKKLLIIVMLQFLSFLAFAEVAVEDISQSYEPVAELPAIDTNSPEVSAPISNSPAKQVVLPLTNPEQNSEAAAFRAKIAELEQQLANTHQQMLQMQTQMDLAKIDNDRASPSVESVSSTTEESSSEVDPDQQAYQDAFSLLAAKRYDDALQKMQNYLQTYPNGKYSVNAYYWSGEMEYLQSKFTDAAEAFQTVITKYPDSPKVPDAMYKLAMIYEIQGKQQQAEQEFQQLKTKYPSSTAARLAAKQLKSQ